MQQGYFKEQEQYLKLFARNEEGKATVQERKFLKKYGECRYWWYMDCAREDELAFFRLGVDADEVLNNEDKPLFPNIAYSYADDPVLAYIIDNATHTEYMPPTYAKSAKQRVRKRLIKMWNKNEKVVYADMRKMFNPDTTKIHDLEFLFHCFGKHAGAPTDPKEKELFVHLFSLYSKEINHLAQMMHFPELENLRTAHPKRRLNPLYVAYKQRWLGVNPVKDFEKVFHGVTLDEYQKIVNAQYEQLGKKPQRKSKNKPANKDFKKQIDDLLLFIIKQK